MSGILQGSVHSEEIKHIWALFQETDRELRKTAREADKRFQKLEKAIGDIAGKWGRFVEGMIVPGMVALFERRGIDIERLSQRVKVRKNGDEMEIDIMGVNGDYVVLVEVKSTLSPDDVTEFIEKLKKFRYFFPEYADRNVIGAVAGIVIDGGADKFAYRQGLFVIAQKGENVKFLNDRKFKPKEF
jgi:hypothetical protein